MSLIDNIKESVAFISSKVNNIPKKAVVLGSGLHTLADEISDKNIISYNDIPHFKSSTAPGHKGELIFGKINNEDVILLNGRLHYYEGYSMQETVYPIRVLSMLGVETLIVTNAAGGINKDFSVGDLMIITDHIKLCSDNPLRGENLDYFGPRFNDMTNAYDIELRQKAIASANSVGINIKTGVYAYMSGPCFETPAEIKMLGILGADAVGMSTVAEVICANHCGMKVLGISCITNVAAGITGNKISSDEVNETGEKVKDKFSKLVKAILINI